MIHKIFLDISVNPEASSKPTSSKCYKVDSRKLISGLLADIQGLALYINA